MNDIIPNIIEFHSTEMFIYFFPKHATHNNVQYEYSHVINIKDKRVRFKLFLWMFDRRIKPVHSFVVDYLCRWGEVYLLNRLVRSIGLEEIMYSHRAVDWASTYGKTSSLEWLYSKYNVFIKSSFLAIDGASENGYVDVLKWWEEKFIHDNILLKYTKHAIDKTQSVRVLDWWLQVHHKYDIMLKYSTKSIDSCTDTNILNWWLYAFLNYGVRLKYKMWAINNASSRGDIYLLDWWFNKIQVYHIYITIKYSEIAINQASANGHIHVLDWWLDNWETNRFPMKYSSNAIDHASGNGHIHVLEWWFKHHRLGKVLFKRSVAAVNLASINGHIHVLDWWLNLHNKYKIPLLYNNIAIEGALSNTDMISWWSKQTQT